MNPTDVGDAVFGVETRHSYLPTSRPLHSYGKEAAWWTMERDAARHERWLPVRARLS